MPLIFPGQGTNNPAPQFNTAIFDKAGLADSYLLGIVPEASAIYESGSQAVTETLNQGVTRSLSPITQADTGNSPIYDPTGGVNGFPCFTFDGSGQYLDISGEALEIARDVGGLTISIVHQPDYSADNMRMFAISGSESAGDIAVAFTIYNSPRGLRVVEVTPQGDNYSYVTTFFTPRTEPCCEFIVLDFVAGTLRYYYNFILVSEQAFTSTGNTADVAALNFRFGAGTNGDLSPFWGYSGKLTAFDVWQGALSPVALADLAQSCIAKYFPNSNNSIDVVYCAGDGNMAGEGLEFDETVPWFIQENINTPKTNTYIQNLGLDGLTAADTLQYLENDKYVLAKMPVINTKNRVVCYLGAMEDNQAGFSVADIISNISNMMQFYKRNGIKTVVGTMLPMISVSTEGDAIVNAVNTLLRANYASYGIDVLAETHNAVENSETSGDFQEGGIYLSIQGATKIGGVFVAAIESLSGWTNPIFEDDFDGPTLDDSKWITTLAWGGRNNGATGEVQWYVDDAFSIADSVLSIEANDTEVEPGFPYTSGVIETFGKFTMLYGYAEARIKVPEGNGYWPAFWMLPYDITWPPENDIMENGGKDTSKAFFSFHWLDVNGDHDWVTIEVDGITPSLSDDFHIFAIDWRPGSMTWFLDGAQVAQFTQSQFISNIPMYLIANLAIGSNWGDIGPPDETTPFPATMEIDYIRAWS